MDINFVIAYSSPIIYYFICLLKFIYSISARYLSSKYIWFKFLFSKLSILYRYNFIKHQMLLFLLQSHKDLIILLCCRLTKLKSNQPSWVVVFLLINVYGLSMLICRMQSIIWIGKLSLWCKSMSHSFCMLIELIFTRSRKNFKISKINQRSRRGCSHQMIG